MQRIFQHWIATKWLEIDQDNLRMKFSALNVDFSSPIPDPLGSSRPAQASMKDGYPLKVFILPQLSRVAWKRLQIGTDMLLIITSNSDNLFIGVNVNDLEWPWTSKIGVLVIFLWFPAATHIFRVNCTEMAGDGPGQLAYDVFSIERTFLKFWSL